MHISKNLKILLTTWCLFTFVEQKTFAAEECFEEVSRSIHKFNMGFDEAIL